MKDAKEFKCNACGHQGPTYGGSSSGGLSSRFCKKCGKNDQLEEIGTIPLKVREVIFKREIEADADLIEIANKYIRELDISYGDLNLKAEGQIRDALMYGIYVQLKTNTVEVGRETIKRMCK